MPRHLTSQHSHANLLTNMSSVTPGSSAWVALRLELDPGWHTYWTNPGATGLPMQIRWELPEGVSVGELQFPTPERVSAPPLVTYGYKGEVTFLSQLNISQSLSTKNPITLRAHAQWLVCEKSCLPAKESFTLTLPQNDPYLRVFFQEAQNKLPQAKTPFSVEAGETPSAFFFKLHPVPKAPIDLFPLDSRNIRDEGRPLITSTADSLWVGFKKSPTNTAPTHFQGLVTTQEHQSFVVKAQVTTTTEQPPASFEMSAPPPSLPIMIVFAWAGGLLLNAMPCVFPVLSLKAMSFLKLKSPSEILKQSLWTTTGIMVSFWMLMALLFALRAGGESLGWGFQLQSPNFVAALAALFWCMGLQMLGVIEFGHLLSRLGGSVKKADNEALESFLSGALITVVATPCTAPLMGSAVGFALTQSHWIAGTVLTSLGLGVATPYLVVGIFPKLIRWLPKPGLWMQTLKQLFAFPLFATTVWLGSVYAQQKGLDALTSLIWFLLALSGGLWWLVQKHVKISVVFLLISLGIAATSWHQSVPASEESWSPEKVRTLQLSGKKVLVDFTAAWCLTCQINKKWVLEKEATRSVLRSLNIVLLKADWTDQNPEITEALRKLGRSGVPTYALYHADLSRAPVLLPEILTLAAIQEAAR